MKILKNIWAGLTKKYGDRDSDSKYWFWFVGIVGVLSVTHLVIKTWMYATLGESDVMDAYLTATLWCGFFYAFFLMTLGNEKMWKEFIDLYEESYAGAMKGWGEALQIARSENEYAEWLEKKVGFASEDLRKEYAATLSTTDPA